MEFWIFSIPQHLSHDSKLPLEPTLLIKTNGFSQNVFFRIKIQNSKNRLFFSCSRWWWRWLKWHQQLWYEDDIIYAASTFYSLFNNYLVNSKWIFTTPVFNEPEVNNYCFFNKITSLGLVVESNLSNKEKIVLNSICFVICSVACTNIWNISTQSFIFH